MKINGLRAEQIYPEASADGADNRLYGMLGFPLNTRHTPPPYAKR